MRRLTDPEVTVTYYIDSQFENWAMARVLLHLPARPVRGAGSAAAIMEQWRSTRQMLGESLSQYWGTRDEADDRRSRTMVLAAPSWADLLTKVDGALKDIAWTLHTVVCENHQRVWSTPSARRYTLTVHGEWMEVFDDDDDDDDDDKSAR